MKPELRTGAVIALALVLCSCAGSARPPAVGPGDASAMPRFLEIYSTTRAMTLSFPAGAYSLAAADRIGYYYRAPRRIEQGAGVGRSLKEGGIFVSRHDQRKLRGYVYIAGGVTLVGNLSGVAHQFHD